MWGAIKGNPLEAARDNYSLITKQRFYYVNMTFFNN